MTTLTRRRPAHRSLIFLLASTFAYLPLAAVGRLAYAGPGVTAVRPSASPPASAAAVVACQVLITGETVGDELDDQAIKLKALESLIASVPKALPGRGIEHSHAFKVLTQYIMPGLRYRTQLVLNAMVGMASMGKSTLFNAIPAMLSGRREILPGERISPAHMDPGVTKRPLIMINPMDPESNEYRDLLARYLEIEPYREPGQVRTSGPALLYQTTALGQYPDQAWVDGGDVSSGEPGVDSGPVNLEAARRTFLPADVFYVAFSHENSLDFSTNQTLQSNFSEFGVRKTVLFMRVNRSYSPKVDLAPLRKQMIKVANIIYNRPGSVVQPPEVLGMFIIFQDDSVYDQINHPQPYPLDGTPSFPILADTIGSSWQKIKADGITAASANLVKILKKEMSSEVQKVHAAQIFAEASTMVADDLSRRVIATFPYRDAAKTYRRSFARHRFLVGPFHAFSEKLFAPQTMRPESILGIDLKNHQASLDEVNLEIEHRLIPATERAAKVALDHLKQGRALITRDGAAAGRLRDLIARYNKLYPGDAVQTEGVAAPPGLDSIALPRLDLLSDDGKARWREFADQPPARFANGLLRTGEGKLRARLTNDRIHAALKMVAKGRYDDASGVFKTIGKATPETIDTGALVVGVAIAKLAAMTLLPGAGTVYAVAAAAKILSMNVMNTQVEPKLDRWFADYQAARYRHAARGAMTALTKELKAMGDERQTHLRAVQEALIVLDPDYQPLAMDLP